MPYIQEFKEIDHRKVQRQFTLYRNYTPCDTPVVLSGPPKPQLGPLPADAVVRVYEIGQTSGIDPFSAPKRNRGHSTFAGANASLGAQVVEYLEEHGACTGKHLVEALGAANVAAISWGTRSLREKGRLEKWSMDAGFVHTPLGASMKRRPGGLSQKLHDKIRSSDSPVYPTPLSEELGKSRKYLISLLSTLASKGELERVSEAFELYTLPGYEPSAPGQKVQSDV